jgi:hypothetical protein
VADRPRRTRWIAGVALSLLLAAIAYGIVVRPILAASTQIPNFELMKTYVRGLEAYKQQQGFYPERLSDAVRERPVFGHPIEIGQDLWGHPLSYRRDGGMFLLVSFGRDGTPDGTDYGSLTPSTVWRQDEAKACKNPDADQVVSEKGWLRACAK